MGKTSKLKVIEWIEEEEKIEVPIEVSLRRTYDEKLVAFFDILGMTEKVSESSVDAEEILTIMGQIQTYVKTECNSLVKEKQLIPLQLGDGFFIVAELDCINELCNILSKIQWKALIYSNMLIRGALTAGKVVVGDDERYFIGPAIIEAFKLERQNAIFPRVIYANEINNYITGVKVDFKYIVEGKDKIKYIDYIQHNIDNDKLTMKKLDH